jgi:hypothetical protein
MRHNLIGDFFLFTGSAERKKEGLRMTIKLRHDLFTQPKKHTQVREPNNTGTGSMEQIFQCQPLPSCQCCGSGIRCLFYPWIRDPEHCPYVPVLTFLPSRLIIERDAEYRIGDECDNGGGGGNRPILSDR